MTHAPEQHWQISALCDSPFWPPLGSANTLETTEQLLATARRDGVAACVFHSIRNRSCWRDLPQPLQQGLFNAAKKAMAWDIASRTLLTDALEALSSNGIDFILLKGIGLAHLLYPAPHLRARGDTDLLVADRGTAGRAWRILEKLGYQKDIGIAGHFVSHQFSCSKPGAQKSVSTLDLHWRLSNSNFFARKFSFEELWEERRAVDALGPHAAALSARHTLIHSLFHRVWHLGEGDPERLIWLYDIHLLCSSFDARDWEGFIEEANRRGLQPICQDGLRDVSVILGTSVPSDVFAALSAGPSTALFGQLRLKSPGARRKIADLLSLPTWMERLGLIREHLFPDATYMRERFGADTRWMLPFAYLSRAANSLRKRLRP